jgi:site-specific recombinase XerD
MTRTKSYTKQTIYTIITLFEFIEREIFSQGSPYRLDDVKLIEILIKNLNVVIMNRFKDFLSSYDERGRVSNAETINNYFNNLKTIFRALANEQLIAKNPFLLWKRIKISRSAVKHSIPDYILSDLFSPLKEGIDSVKFTDYRNSLLCYFLLTTGSRITAGLLTKWSDISEYKNRFKILLHEKGNKEIEKPLPAKFVELLIEYRERYGKAVHKQKILDEYGKPKRYSNGRLKYKQEEIEHDYIFCGRHGGVLTQRTIQMWFQAQMENNDATAHFTPHSLRHTAALRMYIRSDKDIMATSQMLGHANISTTQRYIQEMDRLDSNLPDLLAEDLLGG